MMTSASLTSRRGILVLLLLLHFTPCLFGDSICSAVTAAAENAAEQFNVAPESPVMSFMVSGDEVYLVTGSCAGCETPLLLETWDSERRGGEILGVAAICCGAVRTTDQQVSASFVATRGKQHGVVFHFFEGGRDERSFVPLPLNTVQFWSARSASAGVAAGHNTGGDLVAYGVAATGLEKVWLLGRHNCGSEKCSLVEVPDGRALLIVGGDGLQGFWLGESSSVSRLVLTELDRWPEVRASATSDGMLFVVARRDDSTLWVFSFRSAGGDVEVSQRLIRGAHPHHSSLQLVTLENDLIAGWIDSETASVQLVRLRNGDERAIDLSEILLRRSTLTFRALQMSTDGAEIELLVRSEAGDWRIYRMPADAIDQFARIVHLCDTERALTALGLLPIALSFE